MHVRTQIVEAFTRSVASFNQTLLATLPARHPNGQKFALWITGHSLGGALSTLYAARIKTLGYSIDGIYTYGSPRVGDKRFVDAYQAAGLTSLTYRWVHRDDIITQVRACVHALKAE